MLLKSTSTPKNKNIKYHNIGKVLKSNRKIIERVKIDTPDMKFLLQLMKNKIKGLT